MNRVFVPLAALILAFGLPFAVYLAGGMFGQRCANIHAYESIEWDRCVTALSEGKPLQ